MKFCVSYDDTEHYFEKTCEFFQYLEALKLYKEDPIIQSLVIYLHGTMTSRLQRIITRIFTEFAVCFQKLEKFCIHCPINSNLFLDLNLANFPNLKILKTLHIRVLAIEKVLPQLIDVCLIHANIDRLPANFNPNIESIVIRNNHVSLDIRDLSHLSRMHHITLHDVKLKSVPILPNTGQLLYLDVSVNEVTEIRNLPDTITQLYINTNRIRHIDAFPTNVNLIHIWENPLRRFPENMVLCRSLYYIYFQYTEIEMTAMEMRFLEERTNYMPAERMRQRGAVDVYRNGQNVHTSSIQKSFLKSCQSLLLDKIPDQAFTGTGNRYVDENIRGFLENRERHCILYITFGEVFQKVWNRIATQGDDEIRAELLKRLREEMIEAETKCFMGQITRLLNVLVGFYDDICIEIDESEQIYAKIQANRNRNNQFVNVDELVAALREINISEDKIREWVAACTE
jgi:hypothetical protein